MANPMANHEQPMAIAPISKLHEREAGWPLYNAGHTPIYSFGPPVPALPRTAGRL